MKKQSSAVWVFGLVTLIFMGCVGPQKGSNQTNLDQLHSQRSSKSDRQNTETNAGWTHSDLQVNIPLVAPEVSENRKPADAQLQNIAARISDSVFEVVVKKVDPSFATFKKPIPWDLIPFAQRNDAYESIGTAFTVSGGLFLSAAHVFQAHLNERATELFLRDRLGKVYSIQQIYQFSNRRDYIVFSVQGLGKIKPLSTSLKPKLNSRVFAVGNALGKGIVIRDGLLITENFEEEKGEWKWLNYSAPTSLGNSGGPLLNEQGEVIGIVVMKTKDDNYNYALPLSQVQLKRSGKSEIFFKKTYVSINSTRRVFWPKSSSFLLPLSFHQFKKEYEKHYSTYKRELMDMFRKHEDSTHFPNGEGSINELNRNGSHSQFPILLMEDKRIWTGYLPQKISTQSLGEGKSLEFGAIGYLIESRFQTDQEIPLKAGRLDSKAYLDQISDGLGFMIKFAGQEIPIQSLGEPIGQSSYRDQFGRFWQINYWRYPMSQALFFMSSTVLPGQVFSISATIPSAEVADFQEMFKYYSDSLVIDYSGKIKRWREFLKLPQELLPTFFAKNQLKLEDSQVMVHSEHFQIELPKLFSQNLEETQVSLTFAPYLESDFKTPMSLSQVTFKGGEREVAEFSLSRFNFRKNREGKNSTDYLEASFKESEAVGENWVSRVPKGFYPPSHEDWEKLGLIYYIKAVLSSGNSWGGKSWNAKEQLDSFQSGLKIFDQPTFGDPK